MTKQDALRSTAARRERRNAMVLGAGVMFAISAGEPFYRQFGPMLFAVRMVWCGMLVAIAFALPRASNRVFGALLPLACVGSCWLFGTTVWLSGGVASPDFQYMTLLPLGLAVVYQEEIIACVAATGGTLSAVAMLVWLGDAPVAVVADSLSVAAGTGVLAILATLSFRRVRLAELATQAARAEVLEQLALSEHRRGQAERLASLGQLAAGVAHEINNPLQAVSANVQILAAGAVSCAGMAAADTELLLADLQHGVGRIAQIVRDLREFSSGASDQLQPCQVDEVIGDALRLAAFKLGKSVEVRRQCAPDLPPVAVNRRKLSQVLLNLLINAADAMDEAGTAKPWVLVAAARAGDAVEIAVEDNGPGIAREVADRLFEPFVTTKPVGKGTGLGLALSREYVMGFGGRLEYQPVGGAGARFVIALPDA